MRDPSHPAWPDMGERTELADVAERWRRKYHEWVEDEQRARQLGRRRPRDLEEMVREYTAHRRGLVEAETLAGDAKAFAHLKADWGNALVEDIDPQKTLDRLLRKVSPNTVRVYSAHLSGFWTWLGLPYSVKLPKTQKAEARAWDEDEVERIREKADKAGLLLPVDCGLYMGLRKSEIWGLEWRDVQGHTVRVRRQYPNRSLKGKRARTAVVLRGWTHRPGEGRVCAQDDVGGQQRRLREVLKAAQLDEPGVLWHSLRHSYALRFLEATPDLRLLRSSLGHASVTLTESTYDHMKPDEAARLAVERIHGKK